MLRRGGGTLGSGTGGPHSQNWSWTQARQEVVRELAGCAFFGRLGGNGSVGPLVAPPRTGVADDLPIAPPPQSQYSPGVPYLSHTMYSDGAFPSSTEQPASPRSAPCFILILIMGCHCPHCPITPMRQNSDARQSESARMRRSQSPSCAQMSRSCLRTAESLLAAAPQS